MARRTLRVRHAWIALLLIPAPSASTAAQDKAAPAADPMAHFAKLVGNEWRQTAQSGKSLYHVWHWGPGRHSVRRMTDGEAAGGGPWREVQVYYWHPGRKQVRLLGLSPFARGVFDGSLRFDGATADGTSDLYQTGGRRKMGHRWAFDGRDKYRDTLLEANAAGGYTPLVEFDLVRVKPPAAPRPRAVEGAKPSAHLNPFEPLLGHSWKAKGKWAGGDFVHTQTTFEWVPLADAVYARVAAPGKDGEHLLDAYLYHHTGADVLLCLALSGTGGVYEGEVRVADGVALQLDLNGHEGERAVRRLVRFDFEADGAVRQRVWSVAGTDRTLLLEVRHTKLKP